MTGLFVRVAAREGATLRMVVDGAAIEARAGDTLLTAILLARAALRRFEFGDGTRAGFCLMGACQDCWVALADGTRVRACTTPAAEGMRVTTGLADG